MHVVRPSVAEAAVRAIVTHQAAAPLADKTASRTPGEALRAVAGKLGLLPRGVPTATRTPYVAPQSLDARALRASLLGAWKCIASTIAKKAPGESLPAMLQRLRFAPHLEDGKLQYRRGNEAVVIVEKRFAGRPVSFLEVRSIAPLGAGLQGYRGVHFFDVLVPWRLWGSLERQYVESLGQYVGATLGDGERRRPLDMPELRRALELGLAPAQRARRAAQKREVAQALAGLTDDLARLKAQGKAPESIVFYTEGPDAAGKTSTGAIVMDAFAAAGYSIGMQAFKAPSDEEKKQPWLQRFDDGWAKPGEARRFDRGPAGSVVYAPKLSESQKAQMAREFLRLERRHAEAGSFMFKLELFADRNRQARTLGKRLARAFIAEQLMTELTSRNELTKKAKAGLTAIAATVGPADFRAFATYASVQRRFVQFTQMTSANAPWAVIDATNRHAARLEVIARVRSALKAYVSSREVVTG